MATDAKTAVAVTITAGQTQDLGAFDATMAEAPEPVAATSVVADQAYDCDALRADLAAADFAVTIPPRRGRTQPADYDRVPYRLRNRAERLKRLGRLAGLTHHFRQQNRWHSSGAIPPTNSKL